jgi:hypothetical protein
VIYQVTQSPTMASDMRIAFLEQIIGYEPNSVVLLAGREDLIDPEGPIAMSNLRLTGYELKMIDVVRFVDGTDVIPIYARHELNTSRVETPAGDEVLAQLGRVD